MKERSWRREKEEREKRGGEKVCLESRNLIYILCPQSSLLSSPPPALAGLLFLRF